MRRSVALFATIFCFVGSRTQCQTAGATPDQGVVTNNIYTNQFFGITWELPKDWLVDAPNKPNGRALTLLQVHPGGKQSSDLVALTAQDFTDVWNFSSQYMDALRPLMEKEGWQSLNNNGYYTLGGGIPAHREDYKKGDPPRRFAVVLAGPFHGYELKVLIHSDSNERIQDLIKAVLLMKVQPDWKSLDANAPSPADAHSEVTKRVRVSSQVLQTLANKKVPPVYPSDARHNHVQGSVVMLVHVGQNGELEDIYVQEGNPVLAKAAVAAVSQWTYKPYQLNGSPAKLESMVIVNFQLH